ncbi:unnamed protein product [Pleuronectes platessa]|uniref:Uncharacterized protein n=1 Tax=Pleuronectes platessa TaxID=8262 RepID=A0A9N7VLX4_PLEPL|nr:unnamed protein product [Pleuronectes platessa]
MRKIYLDLPFPFPTPGANGRILETLLPVTCWHNSRCQPPQSFLDVSQRELSRDLLLAYACYLEGDAHLRSMNSIMSGAPPLNTPCSTVRTPFGKLNAAFLDHHTLSMPRTVNHEECGKNIQSMKTGRVCDVERRSSGISPVASKHESGCQHQNALRLDYNVIVEKFFWKPKELRSISQLHMPESIDRLNVEVDMKPGTKQQTNKCSESHRAGSTRREPTSTVPRVLWDS